MAIFERDDTAWSAWTKALEEFTGDPGKPLIVQSPTIMRPLDVRSTVDQSLAWYRKYLVADTIPFYGNKNPNAYVSGLSKTVSLGYHQYLNELNREVIRRFVNQADAGAIEKAGKSYEAAQQAFVIFRRNANADWKKAKAADPGLSRESWEADYGAMGYRPQYNALDTQVKRTYGEYKALSSPYPQVVRVAQALARMDNGVGTQIPLPTSEDDLNVIGREGWDSFFKSNIELGEDWKVFFSTDGTDIRQINESSKQSSYYNHSWSAGGSVSYGYFSVSGGAAGGTVESHLRTDTQAVRFSFKRLVLGTIARGSWYDAGLVTSLPYYGYVAAGDYWGPNGSLNLVPVSVIIGRGIKVEIATSKTAYDSYQNWRKSGGNLGFGVGPFRIGARGSSSTEWGSTNDTSSGTTLTIEETSGQAFIVGVILMKMDEIPSSTGALFLETAMRDYSLLARQEEEFVTQHRSLMR